MAIALRSTPGSCIFHNDRGSQCWAHDEQKVLSDHALETSMSGEGNCLDNAAFEALFETITAELISR